MKLTVHALVVLCEIVAIFGKYVYDDETCDTTEMCYKSEAGCYHVGVQSTEDKCSVLGDSGQCRPGGIYTCESCKRGIVKTKKCPYMCGFCRTVAMTVNSTTCAADPSCYESQFGCFHFGERGNATECGTIGQYGDGSDGLECVGDKSVSGHGCLACGRVHNGKQYRKYWCPIMCGYCNPRPKN